MSTFDIEIRNKKMEDLRYIHAWTLSEIAKKYKISRERVRQIVGSGISRRDISENVRLPQDPSLTSSELVSIARKILPKISISVLRKKIASQHHAVSGENCGDDGELNVNKKLDSVGIKNKLMPFGSPYDIITNRGIRIDVKTSKKLTKDPKGISEYYRFRISKDTKSECDFFIFYAINDERYWIIPFDVLPKTESIYIRKTADGISWKNALYKEWNKYENRFDLLER
jgi:hypothetical protein